MAQIRLPPPDPFDFRNPDDWPRWKRRFQQFREASGLSGESASKQISTLLYCLGEAAECVLASTNATAEDRADYDRVLERFDGHFNVRKNVIYERARFNRRNQQSGETAEQYIMALYELSEHCDYDEMKEEMIRDRLVVGIRDTTLSERLQMDPKLTLESAKKAIRQREAVHEQQRALRGGDSQVDAIHPRRSRTTDANRKRGRGKFAEHRNPGNPSNTPSKASTHDGAKCGRCGRERHPREKCPAKDAKCHNCQKVGHYSALCRRRTVSTLQEGDTIEAAFLDTLTPKKKNGWYATIAIQEKAVIFKLDTGAAVTAISQETWQMVKKPQLRQSNRQLFGPARQALEALGDFNAHLSYNGRETHQQVYVVNNLHTNLLGLPAISALHLATRIDTVDSLPTTDEIIKRKFPNIFKGLGNLGEEYDIKLQPDAKPFALFTSRHIPIPLHPKVAEELEKMEKAGVISKVTEPTPWCAGMVVVPKKSGNVRICVDLKLLNKSVQREVHPIPKVDETLAQLSGAKIFSKLDANSGFWQIPLSRRSRLLTTFITPTGRYCFNKLPFGISSAPEHFQRRMSEILSGLEGVQCQMDDILVYGKDQKEHDTRLKAVLNQIEKAGATLNASKCEFSKTSLTFLGHVIDADGIHPDPEKTRAIRELKTPTVVPELRRFLGMVNQLGKFTPNLAELTQPLRELLTKSRAWMWGPAQSTAFKQVKDEISKPSTLALYDPAAPTKISADASSYGLGAVLLQQSEGHWKAVAFASRAMTDTERRYAQIEKEALATTWACEKFSTFIIGKHIFIETDHKPLVPLLGVKQLDTLPPRVLRFRLRLDRFNYNIQHVPGKEMYTADTLSRAPLTEQTSADSTLQQELAELCMLRAIDHLPAGSTRLEKYKTAQSEDPVCATLLRYCRDGWPEKQNTDTASRAYWEFRGEITMGDGLLLRGNRIIVPEALQQETLRKLHSGHQGLVRCRLRASTSVWWPGLSKQITNYVSKCPECAKEFTPRKEPLIPASLPDYPWQTVATDLFHLNGENYLVTVDYFSRYPEVSKLRTTTSQTVINTLKEAFARHGIPETLRSDNGPQFASKEFKDFTKEYQFIHTTSSPYYPASNGQAERMVKTVKSLLKNAEDPYIALLSHRATPLPWCGKSPAQLLMGRNIRSTLPQTTKT